MPERPVARIEKVEVMIPFKSPLQLTVPPTLEKRLEALAALRTLQAQDEEFVRQRRAAIVALRRDVDELQRIYPAFLRWFEIERAEVRRLFKYNPDEPRVPKGSSHGGEWTSEDSSGSSSDSMARPVADEHPSSGRGPQYAALATNVVSDADEGAAHGQPDAVPGSATGTDVAEDAPHSQPQRPKDDDASAADSDGKSENGAPLFSGGLHDKVMQYYRDQILAGGYNDDSTVPTLHAYATCWDRICATGNSCTLENVRASVLAYQVPGYNGTVIGSDNYPVTLPGIGYIGDVRVIDNDTSISNETLPGHMLYYGYITNTLEVRPDGIYVRTIGEGVSLPAIAQINQFFGASFFSQQHVLMRQHFDANFGSPQ